MKLLKKFLFGYICVVMGGIIASGQILMMQGRIDGEPSWLTLICALFLSVFFWLIQGDSDG